MSNTVLSTCSPFKLALVQIGAGADKSKNLSHARDKIIEASKNGAQIVVLPVCSMNPLKLIIVINN
jgi:predicted amidohydrolase